MKKSQSCCTAVWEITLSQKTITYFSKRWFYKLLNYEMCLVFLRLFHLTDPWREYWWQSFFFKAGGQTVTQVSVWLFISHLIITAHTQCFSASLKQTHFLKDGEVTAHLVNPPPSNQNMILCPKGTWVACNRELSQKATIRHTLICWLLLNCTNSSRNRMK